MPPPADQTDSSSLHAALLKRATQRIEELEARLAAADGAGHSGADAEQLRRLEMRLRDQHTEVAARVAAMTGAYQQLVAQLRTISMSLQELAALSGTLSESIDALSHVAAAAPRERADFALDVPAGRPPPDGAEQDTSAAGHDRLDADPSAPSGEDPEAALTAAADALLATLADVEASLDEALEDGASQSTQTPEPQAADAGPPPDEAPHAEPDPPAEHAAAEPPTQESPAEEPPADAKAEDEPEKDEPEKDEPEKDEPASRTGSRYERRSAKLPRLGDKAQQEALATARTIRNVLYGD